MSSSVVIENVEMSYGSSFTIAFWLELIPTEFNAEFPVVTISSVIRSNILNSRVQRSYMNLMLVI
jgi:hypothetical protein